MPIKITLLYTALLALLTLALMINVVVKRNRHKISLGNGGNAQMTMAVRAHGNLTENAPIALLALLMLEIIGTTGWVLHLLGAALVIGRLLHAHALLNGKLPGRVIGAVTTNTVILASAIMLLVAYTGGKV